MKKIIAFALLFTWSLLALTQTFIPGNAYFGTNEYIEYLAGNIPVIISAPHGGSLEPASIPNRNCSGCVYVRDTNTEQLARAMQTAIFELLGCYPHVIINRLHRRKLDANRAIGDAADGNAEAELAWNEFHDFITAAKDSTSVHFGKGLYLDLHGHGHDIQRLELGYLLSKSELQLSNAMLDQPIYIDESSIKNLVSQNLSAVSHSTLLRGEQSFGELYEEAGYPAVPSKTDPFPLDNEAYFSGGYNTDRHSSIDGGSIDGIQIECNYEGVRDSDSNRTAFAAATAQVVKSYFEAHYFGAAFLDLSCGLTPAETIIPEPAAIQISPNPFHDQVNISFLSTPQPPIHITLYNALGKLLIEKQLHQMTATALDTRFLNSGLYILTIRHGQRSQTIKLIK